MTKEKEQKNFKKMYDAMVGFKGIPLSIHIDGDYETYTQVLFTYEHSAWITEIHKLSNYEYVNIKELYDDE